MGGLIRILSRMSAGMGCSKISAGIGRIGQECLMEWTGFVECVSWKGHDWLRVTVKIGRIGQERLLE